MLRSTCAKLVPGPDPEPDPEHWFNSGCPANDVPASYVPYLMDGAYDESIKLEMTLVCNKYARQTGEPSFF